MIGLFISYRSGNHYIGIYPTIDITHVVVKELIEDLELLDKFITISQLRKQLDTRDDYWHEFSDGTWITIQPIAEGLAAKYKLIK
ncbi:MAG: hypothetical protein KAW87_06690 [Candidatus Cloacimonetes bacterium]|nr:hypothetical protein [Candidatus Cloacimonadota bacterium]